MLDVNEYFNGHVKSIAFQTPAGPATIGVMTPGEYEFATSQDEEMTVVSGVMKVLLPAQSDWKLFHAGESFNVSANNSFEVKVAGDTAYLCTYGQSEGVGANPSKVGPH